VQETVSTATWMRWNDTTFDADSNRLVIRTVDYITHVFDITTGILMESERDSIVIEAPVEKYIFVAIGAVTVCILILIFLFIRKRPK